MKSIPTSNFFSQWSLIIHGNVLVNLSCSFFLNWFYRVSALLPKLWLSPWKSEQYLPDLFYFRTDSDCLSCECCQVLTVVMHQYRFCNIAFACTIIQDQLGPPQICSCFQAAGSDEFQPRGVFCFFSVYFCSWKLVFILQKFFWHIACKKYWNCFSSLWNSAGFLNVLFPHFYNSIQWGLIKSSVAFPHSQTLYAFIKGEAAKQES